MADQPVVSKTGAIQQALEGPLGKAASFAFFGPSGLARELLYKIPEGDSKTVKAIKDFIKSGQATSIGSIPDQILNIAETLGLPEDTLAPEDRQYLRDIGKPEESLAGRIGGMGGEIAQTLALGEALAPLKGVASAPKVVQTLKSAPRFVTEGAKQASIAAAQSYSRDKDPVKAAYSGLIAGALGMAGGGIAGRIEKAAAKQTTMSPHDVTGWLSEHLTPKWWASQSIKTARKDLSDKTDQLTDTFMELGKPFTVAGKNALKKIYETGNDALDDAVELMQQYSTNMKNMLGSNYKPKPGDPIDLDNAVEIGPYINKAIKDIAGTQKEHASKIKKIFDEFSNAYPGLKEARLPFQKAQELKRDFTRFLEQNVRPTPLIQEVDPAKTKLGKNLEYALKHSIDDAFDAVRNISERYGHTPAAGQAQEPWLISFGEAGKQLSGSFRDMSRKVGDIKDLINVAEILNQIPKAAQSTPSTIKELAKSLLPASAKGAIEQSKYALGLTPKSKLFQDPGKLIEGVRGITGGVGLTASRLLVPSTKVPPSGIPSLQTEQPPAETDSLNQGKENTAASPLKAQGIVDTNNPMAIDASRGDKWVGEIGEQNGRAVFNSPADGIRAGILNLQGPAYKNVKTLRELFHVYAPTTDKRGPNNPDQYAEKVARGIGIGPDDEIDLKNPELLRALAKQIIRGEVPAGYGDKYDRDIDTAISQIFGAATTERPPIPETEAKPTAPLLHRSVLD